MSVNADNHGNEADTRFPVSTCKRKPNAETIAALEEAKRSDGDQSKPRFETAEEMFADLGI